MQSCIQDSETYAKTETWPKRNWQKCLECRKRDIPNMKPARMISPPRYWSNWQKYTTPVLIICSAKPIIPQGINESKNSPSSRSAKEQELGEILFVPARRLEPRSLYRKKIYHIPRWHYSIENLFHRAFCGVKHLRCCPKCFRQRHSVYSLNFPTQTMFALRHGSRQKIKLSAHKTKEGAHWSCPLN